MLLVPQSVLLPLLHSVGSLATLAQGKVAEPTGTDEQLKGELSVEQKEAMAAGMLLDFVQGARDRFLRTDKTSSAQMLMEMLNSFAESRGIKLEGAMVRGWERAIYGQR